MTFARGCGIMTAMTDKVKQVKRLEPRIVVGRDYSIHVENFEAYLLSAPVQKVIRRMIELDLTGVRRRRKNGK